MRERVRLHDLRPQFSQRVQTPRSRATLPRDTIRTTSRNCMYMRIYM